jgi:hypothetical protein
MDAWRAPNRVLNAHPPDQYAEVRLNLRPPSPRARLPTPIAAKAGTMPPHEGLRTDDGEALQDRRKPSIQLDEEPDLPEAPELDIRQALVAEPEPPLVDHPVCTENLYPHIMMMKSAKDRV